MLSKLFGKGRIFTRVTNISVDFVADTLTICLSFALRSIGMASFSHGIFSRDFATEEMLTGMTDSSREK